MSRPPTLKGSPVGASNMLIGALLRVPAQAIHHRIIAELNAAGFADLRLPHMAVLQFPGPDGTRPSILAERVIAFHSTNIAHRVDIGNLLSGGEH